MIDEVEFMDNIARDSWRRALDEMPDVWAEQWRSTLTAGSRVGSVSALTGKIIAMYSDGRITTLEARGLLRPLYSHPVATSWRTGAFVAIADFAACLRVDGDPGDNAYYWSEVERAYQQVVSEAGDIVDAELS